MLYDLVFNYLKLYGLVLNYLLYTWLFVIYLDPLTGFEGVLYVRCTV